MSGLVRAFMATSLDGFIAGQDNDLSWLPEPREDRDYGFGEFLDETSALLMGRNTYAVVAGFGGDWPYGDLPVFVATHRPMDLAGAPPTVVPVSGTADELLDHVRLVTDGHVYVDGGAMVRQFLEEGLLDELTVTLVPVVLGEGTPLFAGVSERQELTLLACECFDDGLVQLTYGVGFGDSVDQ